MVSLMAQSLHRSSSQSYQRNCEQRSDSYARHGEKAGIKNSLDTLLCNVEVEGSFSTAGLCSNLPILGLVTANIGLTGV